MNRHLISKIVFFILINVVALKGFSQEKKLMYLIFQTFNLKLQIQHQIISIQNY